MIDGHGLRKIIALLRSHPGLKLHDFRTMLSVSMEMIPELVEVLAEAFPKLRLGDERSYEHATARYRNNTRQMQEQVRGGRAS